MKASAVTHALRTLVAARQPVFVWGPPGVGKSSVIAQLAKALNLSLRDIRALLLDPVDLRGLPYRSRGTIQVGGPGISACGRRGHSVSG
jgi:MoxR-like ATPase